MKKILLETSFSKIYMIVMIIITLLILGGYFSYAMFTVTKEKENAISIVTGNLTYELLVDDKETNTLTVPANSRQDFIVTLNNPNNRISRFNFYYLGSLPEGVDIGYIEKDEFNVPPTETGINLEKVDTTGSSNTYIVRVANTTESEISIELGVSVGLDYNDLELPDDGHLLRKITSTGTVKEVIEDDIMNRLNYEDEEQTFVTGSNPYNYIWYSGKLWRVVSIDPNDNSVKLVTQWNISAIPYDNDSSAFAGSYMEMWLNDTTVDGFLGNLREPEKFIVTDAVWNATMDNRELGSITIPNETTIVSNAVGLLNTYEYQSSNDGGRTGYLNNGLHWWTLTPYSDSNVCYISASGSIGNQVPTFVRNNGGGIRPSINLKKEVKIVDGDGSEENPYRLEGDNDTNLSGTLLNTRYSGEYITFGTGENNLYRIVSHETLGLTKITSVEPLKENGAFKAIVFDSNRSTNYSLATTMGIFLNGEYLTDYIGEGYSNMIEDNTTWYLGIVSTNASYKSAKYTNITDNVLTSNTTTAKVGLLRYGELMTGQFERGLGIVNLSYTGLTQLYKTLTPFNGNWYLYGIGAYTDVLQNAHVDASGIKPALNLKQNVIITSGDGTKNNPFNIELSN